MTTPTPSALDALAAELRTEAPGEMHDYARSLFERAADALDAARAQIEAVTAERDAAQRMTQSAQRIIERLEEENAAAEAALKGAVEAELEACANRAREIAAFYTPHSDGWNTFLLLAEWIEARSASPGQAEPEVTP